MNICNLTTSTIKFNIVFAAKYNMFGMTAAAMGWLHQVAAAVLILVDSLAVTIRSTRIIDSKTDKVARRPLP
ncbi:hypothetical protein MFFC18_23640 [Mariniblastus fucicola]|uniref:Uncharacterized protein n=1 Tax=Mariniblastus fucicola TaxID=980251 RepID=A0A5B9P832_9BACT|nr:hypothetical protein MFFC18_23640 [Mariniblastus fucicola]